ncbi:MAG: DUF3105 domain-containing protein [Euzebya sp.]
MSEDQYGSKRERQKARRQERLQQEAEAARGANRRSLLVRGLIVVLVLSVIGGLVYSQIRSRQQANEQAVAVAGRLDSLGCTEDIRMPDLGGGHITGDEVSLTSEPPSVIYTGTADLPGEPPSSGRHIGQVVPSGVFDVPIDPRFTTHNLEHGYVVIHYSPDAPEDQVQQLKTWAQEQIDGDFPKIVMTEYYQPLPDGTNFSFTAWFHRQTCETFDTDVAEVFTRANYDISGEGPEKGIPAHTGGTQGVVDPDGMPLFLPPLDAELGTPSALDGVEGAEPATDTVDPAADGSAAPASDSPASDSPASDTPASDSPASDSPSE